MKDTIPKSVIDKDHELTEVAGNASMALDRHRWEQCQRYSQHAYARAVGVQQSAISRSVNAWQKALDAAAAADDSAIIGPPEPTPEQHKKAQLQAQRGDDAAEVLTALAQEFHVQPITVAQNHKWKRIRQEALGRVDDVMIEQPDRERADVAQEVAQQIKREEDNVKRLLARQDEPDSDGFGLAQVLRHDQQSTREVSKAIGRAQDHVPDLEAIITAHCQRQIEAYTLIQSQVTGGNVDAELAELLRKGE